MSERLLTPSEVMFQQHGEELRLDDRRVALSWLPREVGEHCAAEWGELISAVLEHAERVERVVSAEPEFWLVCLDGVPDAPGEFVFARVVEQQRQFGHGDIWQLDARDSHGVRMPAAIASKRPCRGSFGIPD